MTCAQCGEREAIVFIRRSGGSSEGCDIVLCDSCAKRRGIIAGKGGLELNIDDLIGVGLGNERVRERPPACPGCGLELGELRREGRLGCARCADAFSEELATAVGRLACHDPKADSLAFAPARVGLPPGTARLRRELESALDSEDYETAAELRDELSHMRGEGEDAPRAADFPDFPYSPFSLSGSSGQDDDVALLTSGRVYRDIAGEPFPGSPRGPAAPSRAILLDRFLSLGAWRSRTMADLGPVGRRSLSERGIVPRGYAADDEAVVLSESGFSTYALLDEGDHLRVRTMAPGLDAAAALGPGLALADRLGRDMDFASRPGIGWVCARIADCGLGCSLSATVHIPALTAAGLRDRLFRALMSDGLAVRGFYSSSEESAGSLYEIGFEASMAGSVLDLAGSFTAAVAKIVAAERRARTEIAERGREALVDAEGRAFGITRYFGSVGMEEAASLVSVLRLAALRGSLPGADHRILGGLLAALGPGSITLLSGLPEIPPATALDAYRAAAVKRALFGADYEAEGGA